MTRGPFALLEQLAAILERLDLEWVLGGSLASSLLGEPRSTADIDLAVLLDDDSLERLLENLGAEFYVPADRAREAVRHHSSFNLVDMAGTLKVDIFVLGDGLLDRMQMKRRVRFAVPGAADGIWVTSAEDQVLRKLEWFERGGAVSDRQWRDVIGLLKVHWEEIDREYLREVAAEVGHTELLDRALQQAAPL